MYFLFFSSVLKAKKLIFSEFLESPIPLRIGYYSFWKGKSIHTCVCILSTQTACFCDQLDLRLHGRLYQPGLAINNAFFILTKIKIIDLPGGPIRKPLSLLPATLTQVLKVSFSWDGAFQGPSTLPRVLLPELQRIKESRTPSGVPH